MDYARLYIEVNKPEHIGKSDAEIAETLKTTTSVELREYMFTKRTLFRELGIARGTVVMKELRTAMANDEQLNEMVALLEDVAGGGINLGLSQSQDYFDSLASANFITQTEADQIKALGQHVVTLFDFSRLTGNNVAEAKQLYARTTK